MKKNFSVDFEELELDALSETQLKGVEAARKAAQLAYAPYSRFRVGAAVELSDGTILTGSNKENASFPAGTCAERNALNYASDQYPGKLIKRMIVVADPEGFSLQGLVAPCGICRQVLCEVEKTQESSIEIILLSSDRKALLLSSAQSLLPFHFYVPQLKK